MQEDRVKQIDQELTWAQAVRMSTIVWLISLVLGLSGVAFGGYLAGAILIILFGLMHYLLYKNKISRCSRFFVFAFYCVSVQVLIITVAAEKYFGNEYKVYFAGYLIFLSLVYLIYLLWKARLVNEGKIDRVCA